MHFCGAGGGWCVKSHRGWLLYSCGTNRVVEDEWDKCPEEVSNSFLWREAAHKPSVLLSLCIISSKTLAVALLFISLLLLLMWNCGCFIAGLSCTLMEMGWPLFILLCCLGTESSKPSVSVSHWRKTSTAAVIYLLFILYAWGLFSYTSFSEWP